MNVPIYLHFCCFSKGLYSWTCYQNKDIESIAKNCGNRKFGMNETGDFTLVDCKEGDNVCLKIRTNFGVIKTCGGNISNSLKLKGDECKTLTNKENWDMKKGFVEELKKFGNGGFVENITVINVNQTDEQPPKQENQTMLSTPPTTHCWDEFEESRGNHILEACQCLKQECNEATKITIRSFHIYIIMVALIAN